MMFQQQALNVLVMEKALDFEALKYRYRLLKDDVCEPQFIFLPFDSFLSLILALCFLRVV
jgi:hypothetical protein